MLRSHGCFACSWACAHVLTRFRLCALGLGEGSPDFAKSQMLVYVSVHVLISYSIYLHCPVHVLMSLLLRVFFGCRRGGSREIKCC